MSKITVRKGDTLAPPTPKPLTFADLEDGEAFYWGPKTFSPNEIMVLRIKLTGYIDNAMAQISAQPGAAGFVVVKEGSMYTQDSKVTRLHATLTWSEEA